MSDDAIHLIARAVDENAENGDDDDDDGASFRVIDEAALVAEEVAEEVIRVVGQAAQIVDEAVQLGYDRAKVDDNAADDEMGPVVDGGTPASVAEATPIGAATTIGAAASSEYEEPRTKSLSKGVLVQDVKHEALASERHDGTLRTANFGDDEPDEGCQGMAGFDADTSEGADLEAARA